MRFHEKITSRLNVSAQKVLYLQLLSMLFSHDKHHT